MLSTSSSGATYQEDHLDLVAQTSYVSADGTFRVSLRWDGDIDPSVELVVSIFGRVEDEQAFDEVPRTVLGRPIRAALSQLPRNDQDLIELDIPIRSFTPGDSSRTWIPEAGVYPVTIELQRSGVPIETLRTDLIRLPTETAEIGLLPVSLVLTVTAADGFTVHDAVALLQEHPTVPLTVLLDRGVLPQLTDDPQVAESLRGVLAERPVIAIPRLDLDPSALAAIGQGELYQQSIEQTRRDLESYGFDSSPDIWPMSTELTNAGASLLVASGVDKALDVGSSDTAGGFIQTDQGTLRVLLPDSALTMDLQGKRRGVLRAHRLLARLAVRVHNERVVVVLGGPEAAKADPSALDVVLSAADQLGLLQAVPISDAEPPNIQIRTPEAPGQDLQPIAGDVEHTLDLIATYRGFHVSGGISPHTLVSDLQAALSRDLNPASRTSAVGAVINTAEQSLDVIKLPESQSVTLASQNPLIPLTIENTSAGSREILLRFESDKLDFAENEQQVTIEPGISTVQVRAQARSVGVSPLEVSVLSPDAQRTLATTRFQVRSTAIPGLGLLLSGIAFVFLLVWWGKSIRKSREHRDAIVHSQTPTDKNLPATQTPNSV